jgi:hypothetical protein
VDGRDKPGHDDSSRTSQIISRALRFLFQHRFVAQLARLSFRDGDHILVVLDEPLCRLLDPTVYRDRNRQS